VADSTLSDDEMKKMTEQLAKVLKGKKNQEEYLGHVQEYINTFTQNVSKHKVHNGNEILTTGQQLPEETHEGENKIK
jgi:hypothetical protein